MKKIWNIKITMIVEREYAEKMNKSEAKEMALEDFYDDIRHGLTPKPIVEITEVK